MGVWTTVVGRVLRGPQRASEALDKQCHQACLPSNMQSVVAPIPEATGGVVMP